MEQAFYRISEVAQVLGIGKSAAYDLVARGEIPSVFLGGLRARRVPADGLRKWITQQSQQASEKQSKD